MNCRGRMGQIHWDGSIQALVIMKTADVKTLSTFFFSVSELHWNKLLWEVGKDSLRLGHSGPCYYEDHLFLCKLEFGWKRHRVPNGPSRCWSSGLREGQQGGGVEIERQLLFRCGQHSGGCAGIDLMGWEGAVDGFLWRLAALISLLLFSSFNPPNQLSIHTDVFWWLVSLKLTSAEEVISQSMALISG